MKMTELEINFSFFYEDHHTIENNLRQTLRRNVALLFCDAGFGDIVEVNGDKYVNTLIMPGVDDYSERGGRLFLAYSFTIPRRNGDVDLLLTKLVPKFMNEIHNSEETREIEASIQFVYSTIH